MVITGDLFDGKIKLNKEVLEPLKDFKVPVLFVNGNHDGYSGLQKTYQILEETGVQVLRNQIYHFVNTKTLFGNGMKFIILDEVDYMTKNAQQALHYLIQKYNTQIRFCLICNYISRIDSALQNEFIRLRFCQLPKNDIFLFLKNITKKENLSIKDCQLQNIRSIFKSDIRSMINFLQSNHTQIDGDSLKIILSDFW